MRPYGVRVDQNRWWVWISDAAGGGTKTAIARTLGVDQSAVTRWSSGKAPDVYWVVAAARRLGRAPIEALVAGGFITEEEARLRHVQVGVEDLGDDQLLAELARRLGRAQG